MSLDYIKTTENARFWLADRYTYTGALPIIETEMISQEQCGFPPISW